MNSFLSRFFNLLICHAHFAEKVHPSRDALVRYGAVFGTNVANLVTLPFGAPVFSLAAAAVIVVVAAAAPVPVVAAVAEQQDQDDDPPPVVVQAAADTVIITHKNTSETSFLSFTAHSMLFGRRFFVRLTRPSEHPPARFFRRFSHPSA